MIHLFVVERHSLQVLSGLEVATSVDGLVTQLLLDSQELVVLSQSLGSVWSTGLDLTRSQTNRQVSNEGVFGLTRSVGNHHTPVGGVGVLSSLDGLGQRTNLVNLQQQGVGGLLLNGGLDSQWVGHEQVITDNLDLVLDLREELGPGFPVILGEWVLDGDNWVLVNQLGVVSSQLLTSEPLGLVGVRVLEVQVVLAVLEELGGGNVQSDANLALVTSLVNGRDNQVQGLLGGVKVRSDTTLVTDVTSGQTVLLLGQGLQGVVDLRAVSHGLGEGRSASWGNHEFLESQGATGVGATVQDVLERNRQDELVLLGAGDVSEVLEQGDTLFGGGGLSGSQGDTQDGVSTQLGLVWGTVQGVQELIHLGLVLKVKVSLNESRSNDLVNIVNGLGDTLAQPLGLVAVSQFESLVDTGGSTRWDNGSEEALFSVKVDFDGWVTSRIVDRTSKDFSSGHY